MRGRGPYTWNNTSVKKKVADLRGEPIHWGGGGGGGLIG